jgi:two-component system cell cycle response regulator
MRLTATTGRLGAPIQVSRTGTAALIAGALLLIFAVDRATDAAPVQHLYYLPIILAGVRFRMPGGISAALSAIALYHVANPHLLTFRYGESDLVQIVLFLAVGTVAAKLTLNARRMRHFAMTDDLTGLHNLRSFEGRLAAIIRTSRRSQAPLALLVADLDRLKSLNDEFGHLTGAEAVRTVGRVIGRRLPPDAVACRYGGDEFVIALPHCTPFLARQIADDLCRAVRDTAPVLSGKWFAAGTLSISVGASWASFDRGAPPYALLLGDVELGESLFRAADAALYRAKATGRNRVCIA